MEILLRLNIVYSFLALFALVQRFFQRVAQFVKLLTFANFADLGVST